MSSNGGVYELCKEKEEFQYSVYYYAIQENCPGMPTSFEIQTSFSKSRCTPCAIAHPFSSGNFHMLSEERRIVKIGQKLTEVETKM